MTHTATIKAVDYKRGIKAELEQVRQTYGKFYKKEPGKFYRYSNLGADLMGSIMEVATKQNVQENLEEGLFQPLGIDAGYHPKFLDRPEDISTTYAAQRLAAGYPEWKAAGLQVDLPRH